MPDVETYQTKRSLEYGRDKHANVWLGQSGDRASEGPVIQHREYSLEGDKFCGWQSSSDVSILDQYIAAFEDLQPREGDPFASV